MQLTDVDSPSVACSNSRRVQYLLLIDFILNFLGTPVRNGCKT